MECCFLLRQGLGCCGGIGNQHRVMQGKGGGSYVGLAASQVCQGGEGWEEGEGRVGRRGFGGGGGEGWEEGWEEGNGRRGGLGGGGGEGWECHQGGGARSRVSYWELIVGANCGS